MTDDELSDHLAETERYYASFDDAGARAAVSALSTPMRVHWWDDCLNRALSAPSRSARVLWLRKEADARTDAVKPISACIKQKCSHCCYQSVAISEHEARVIGAEIGVRVREPAPGKVVAMPKDESGIEGALRGTDELRGRYTGVPCVFLADGRCSIYEARPIACRLLLSLERDDFLCRIIPGHSVRVPYLDVRPENMAYAQTALDSRLADLRDWFPRGRG